MQRHQNKCSIVYGIRKIKWAKRYKEITRTTQITAIRRELPLPCVEVLQHVKHRSLPTPHGKSNLKNKIILLFTTVLQQSSFFFSNKFYELAKHFLLCSVESLKNSNCNKTTVFLLLWIAGSAFCFKLVLCFPRIKEGNTPSACVDFVCTSYVDSVHITKQIESTVNKNKHPSWQTNLYYIFAFVVNRQLFPIQVISFVGASW